MKDIAVVAYSQSNCVRNAGARNEVELIMPVLQDLYSKSPVNSAQDVDFVCSGSCDYQQGAAFAFVSGVDALGAVPPIKESHVEMDAAWALYEAYLKIQMGQADSALLYGFGKSSPGVLSTVLSQQLDPYYLSPLWVDTIAFAAMQARTLLESGRITEAQMAEVVVKSRAAAKNNPKAQLSGDFTVEQLLAEPMYQNPLRLHDCCPISDGACAMIICTVEKAKEWAVPYALIKGIDHRIESHHIGLRDLSRLESVEISAKALNVNAKPVDVAELYAPFSHQELMLTEALGLTDSTEVNPSGGVLAGNLMMASGLSRIGEVADRIIAGKASRGVAHATSGPAMQQNLVCVLEGAE